MLYSNNKEGGVCYLSVFNSSMQPIKFLPSLASGLNVISRIFHIQLPQHQQHQPHSHALSYFHFSPMHQQLPAIFSSYLQI